MVSTRRKKTMMSRNPDGQKGAKTSRRATNGDMSDIRHITICGATNCDFRTTEGNSSDEFPAVSPVFPCVGVLVEACGIECWDCFLFKPKRVRKTKMKPSRKILRD